MTTEQQLQAIIEAQVKGGWVQWDIEEWSPDFGDGAIIVHQDMGEETYDIRVGVLEILLDPAGLKAAYESWDACNYCGSKHDTWNSLSRLCPGCKALMVDAGSKSRNKYVAHKILTTWLSSSGDAVKTIETAYKLLPSQ